MLTLVAQGGFQLEEIPVGSKAQKHAVILKAAADTVWEVVVPDGESFGFNIQTWGEMTRKLLKPITALSDANFAKIVEGTQCYVKTSAKGKEKSSTATVSDDEDDFEDLLEFR